MAAAGTPTLDLRHAVAILVGLIALVIGLVSPARAATQSPGAWPAASPPGVVDLGPVTGEVTLLLYSGLPDPTWQLSVEELQGLEDLLAGLPETDDAPAEGGLGYRGFRAATSDGTLTAYLGTVELVLDGVAEYRLDPDRQVEHFLLETGRPSLGPEEIAAIEMGLGSPLPTRDPSA